MDQPGIVARSSPAPFPWREAMSFGFGILRLSADDFWRLTPRELNAAFEAVYGAQNKIMDQPQLHRLMQLFPDVHKARR